MDEKKNDTQTFTSEDVIIEAKKLTSPTKKAKQRKKYFFENTASLVTVFIIALTIVLYSYNTGFCSIYNIPVECMPLDLKSYIPVAIRLISLLLICSFYLSYIKTEKVLKKPRFNLIRVLYGFWILYVLIRINNINHLLGVKASILISIGMSFFLEFIVFLGLWTSIAPKINSPISLSEYNHRLESFVHDRFIYSYLVKYGVFILIIATLIAPLLGKISAKTKHYYQIIEINNMHYSVIVEYSDRVLVQPATIAEGILHIETSKYEYLPKDNLCLQYNYYDQVVIDNNE